MEGYFPAACAVCVGRMGGGKAMSEKKEKPNQRKKKSVIPTYGIGLVWLSCALAGKLTSFSQVIRCLILSVAVYLVLRLFFPDKLVTQPEQEKQEKKTEQKPKAEEKPKAEPKPETKKKSSTGNAELDEVLEQGQAYIARIVQLNDEIPDFKLSAQIKQIEILTDKILSHVRDNPGKLSEIKQFMSYYLPTTIKLLEQYVVLQNQGMRMGNIDDGMKRIEELLDKVIVAFQKQLDSLFAADVVDITADIQVMEQMMASQGLTDQKDF